MKSISDRGEVHDYAAFCPDYFRGCFACPDFLRGKVRFCRKRNRTFNGADVVVLEIVDREEGASLSQKKPLKEDTGRNWWTYGRSGK